MFETITAPVTEIHTILTVATRVNRMRANRAPVSPEILSEELSHTTYQALIGRLIDIAERKIKDKPALYADYQPFLMRSCFKRITTPENLLKIADIANKYAPYTKDAAAQYLLASVLHSHANGFDGLKKRLPLPPCDEKTKIEINKFLAQESAKMPWQGVRFFSPQPLKNGETCMLNVNADYSDLNGADTIILEGIKQDDIFKLPLNIGVPRKLDFSRSLPFSLDFGKADMIKLEELMLPQEMCNLNFKEVQNLIPLMICPKTASYVDFSNADFSRTELFVAPKNVRVSVVLSGVKNIRCPLDFSETSFKKSSYVGIMQGKYDNGIPPAKRASGHGIYLNGIDFKDVPLFLPPLEGKLSMTGCKNLPGTLIFPKDCKLNELSVSTEDNSLKRLILPKSMRSALLHVGKDIDMIFSSGEELKAYHIDDNGALDLSEKERARLTDENFDTITFAKDNFAIRLEKLSKMPRYVDWSDNDKTAMVYLFDCYQGRNSTMKLPLNTTDFAYVGGVFPERTNLDKLDKLENFTLYAEVMPASFPLIFPKNLKKLAVNGSITKTPVQIDLSRVDALEELEFSEHLAYGTKFILPLYLKDKYTFPRYVKVEYITPDNQTILDLRNLDNNLTHMRQFKLDWGEHDGHELNLLYLDKYQRVLMPKNVQEVDFWVLLTPPKQIDFSDCPHLKKIDWKHIRPKEVIFPPHFAKNKKALAECDILGIKATVAPKKESEKSLLDTFKSRLGWGR